MCTSSRRYLSLGYRCYLAIRPLESPAHHIEAAYAVNVSTVLLFTCFCPVLIYGARGCLTCVH